jgi:hypothetical protein
MRRRVTPLIAIVGLLLLPATASAARPDGNCPTDPSGYTIVDQQTWWDRTVAGFEAEGIHVYVAGNPANGFTDGFDDFAAAIGLVDGQGLYDFVWVTQWQHIDKNGDLLVCMKNRPITKGNPAYFFTGSDNTAN